MRKSAILAIILLIGGSMGLRAQSLKNSAWKLYVDALHDTITLHIKADSSWVTNTSGAVVVQSTFRQAKDTIFMKDVSGQYFCPDGEGVYTVVVKDMFMTFFLVTDPCSGRNDTINGAKWVKAP